MKYFLYARKSSEDKERQIQSIPDQINVLTEIAERRGCTIVDIITDEKTARLPGRTGFNALMERLDHGEAQGILCWKIDRLTRNSLDSGVLQYKLQSGGIQEIVTPEKTHYPDDNTLLLLIECGMATQYSRDLSKNVKRGMQSKVEKGWMPSKAPYGYSNEKHGIKGQKRIVPDPALFPVVASLWRTLLRERLPMMKLYRFMEEYCPLYMKGKLMAFSTFDQIFHSKFYAGLFQWNGEWRIGSHEPMVTLREFEEAQEYLQSGKGTRKRELSFEYKGLLQCGTCRACITAERKTKFVKSLGTEKSYDFYRCAHRKRGIRCTEKPLSKNTLEGFLLKEIEAMSIPDEIIRFGIGTLDTMEKENTETVKEQQCQRELVELRQKIALIERNIAEEQDSETRAIMKKRHNDLLISFKILTEEIEAEQKRRASHHTEIKNRLDLILSAGHTLIHGSPEQKRQIVMGLGSNWRLSGQNLHYDAHFVSSALKATKKKMIENSGMFEPKQSRSGSGRVLDRDRISLVWSG